MKINTFYPINKRIFLLLTIVFIPILCSCNTNDTAKDDLSITPYPSSSNPTDNPLDLPMETIPVEPITPDPPTSTDNITDNSDTLGDTMNENDFYITEITEDIFSRIQGKSFKNDCTLPVTDLRYLHLLYNDFNNETAAGEMIVNKYIADDVLEIFEELYQAGYQIEKIQLVDDYNADDESSMAANNSSAFNFRFISYTTTISKHGLGMAIDINPLYNPYVKEVNGRMNVEPANATEYVDRSASFPHKIDTNDLAYKLFTEHGFSWGGS